ncbi:DUF4010 domain-containing protein [Candidatus Gracilibacteria bacterium]|nr:DUF4010 domain-containing protein [Candidatus Gracilibacteria bacterium]
MDQILFWNFILAIALGALIGTEREMPRTLTNQASVAGGFGGIRSYALLALLGALTTWLDTIFSSDIWKISGLIISGLFVMIAYAYSSWGKDLMGVTSEYAALVTYLIGVIVMSGERTTAVILSILILLILSSKGYLKNIRERFSRSELGDALKFAVIALVVLPLLPNQKFSIVEMLGFFTGGQMQLSHEILSMHFFNPFGIWFFVVIMAGVEYIGYILSKVLGNHGGVLASGAIGGMISSTATTAAMTSKSNQHPSNRNVYIAATLIASTIMCIRVIAISGFYSQEILGVVMIPALCMLAGLLGTAYYFYNQKHQIQIDKKDEPINIDEKAEYESPFRLIPAIQFAGVIVIVKFLSGLGLIYKEVLDPRIWNYALGALSGLADVDAITQDMASKAGEGSIALTIAASTILIAAMSNNIVKGSIAYRFGEQYFGRGVAIGFGLSIIFGLTAIIVMNFVMNTSAFGV